MANINGTNKSDYLLGTAGDDFIDGKRGNDWIEGDGGNDTLTGGQGRDTFAWRLGDGNDVITDFESGDRVLTDFAGPYSDAQRLGVPQDGDVITSTGVNGTAFFTFSVGDFNSDGVQDVRITATGDFFVGEQTLDLLGASLLDLAGLGFAGG